MTLLSRLTRHLHRAGHAAHDAEPTRADPARRLAAPPAQLMPSMPSRRAWLGPGLAGAAGLAMMPIVGRAEPPPIRPTPGRFDGGISIEEFGAKGDGRTDDAPAFQAAINSLGEAGGRILLGAKHYRLASPITITRAYVEIQGQGYGESPGPSGGTWLVMNTANFQPFMVTNLKGNETRGTSFRDLAVYQIQPPSRPGWAPTDYPFVFKLDQLAGGVEFHNIYFCNVTRGIHSYQVGRLNIGYMKGQCYDTMVYIETALDVCRIDQLESWFFVTGDQYVADYMADNYDAIRLGRADGVFINMLFVFCARAGIHCVQQKVGCAQFVINAYSGDHIRYAVWFDHCNFVNAGPSTITSISSSSNMPHAGVKTFPGGGQIKVENCAHLRLFVLSASCALIDGSVIQVTGNDNKLFLGAIWYDRFNQGKHTPPAPAVFIGDSGGAPPNIVTASQPVEVQNSNGGGSFGTEGNGVFIDPSTRFAEFLAALPSSPPAGGHGAYVQNGVVRRS